MANPAAPSAGAEHEEKKKRVTAAGAWALDAEREERERAAAAVAGGDKSFPSLHAAVSAKTKRKKPVAIPLAKFVAPEPQCLTTADLLRLPTGPRERSADELYKLRPYAGFGGRPSPQPPPDLDLPSKADEAGSWAAGVGFSAPPERRGRYTNLGFGSSSCADEVDNWRSGKQQLLPPPPGTPTTMLWIMIAGARGWCRRDGAGWCWTRRRGGMGASGRGARRMCSGRRGRGRRG